jgi:hypothetical protein
MASTLLQKAVDHVKPSGDSKGKKKKGKAVEPAAVKDSSALASPHNGQEEHSEHSGEKEHIREVQK